MSDERLGTMSTIIDKLWATHEVEPGMMYVDLHLVHEVTSPQAFAALRDAGRRVRRPAATLATADHSVPTDGSAAADEIRDVLARRQVEALERNCAEFGIPCYSLGSVRQGIVHVIAPELGLTQPGMTIVCGDSHTSTHGAFGALAFAIGTSDVEHVLATQTLIHPKPARMRIAYDGSCQAGVSAKDVILATIGAIGTRGAAGHAVEFTGRYIEGASMEQRMTICNMTAEAGGRTGVVAPDDTTYAWIEGRPAAPEDMDRAVAAWSGLRSDPSATFDREASLDVAEVAPQVTWGSDPAQVVAIGDAVPEPTSDADERALDYMALRSGEPIEGLPLDRVFIGSCTNARLSDLREAAAVVKGRRVASSVTAIVVPGSQGVRAAAEREGLDRVFRTAGFEWRSAGCSMCVAMNDDVLPEGERCVSTSNRNFEGRQGKGGRTHLASPQMAAAAAVAGRIVDVRKLL